MTVSQTQFLSLVGLNAQASGTALEAMLGGGVDIVVFEADWDAAIDAVW